MSIEAISCQPSLLTAKQTKSVSFRSDTKPISEAKQTTLKPSTKRTEQEDLIEQEMQKLLAKLFAEAKARLSADKEEFTQKRLRDEMWKLVDDKAVGKTDSGKHEFDKAEIHALLFDIYNKNYVPSDDPQELKGYIETAFDVDAVVNEDGTFSLYYSTKCPRSIIDRFLCNRQKYINKYLYDTDLRARKELGKAAVDSELLFQKISQMENEQSFLTKSDIRWFVEENEENIMAGLKDLRARVLKKNPQAADDKLIGKMFLENRTVHAPTVEELHALYFAIYNRPYSLSDTARTESKQLVEELRPHFLEVEFLISDDGKEITMFSSHYPQICMQHITNYVNKLHKEAKAPADFLREKISWGSSNNPLIAYDDEVTKVLAVDSSLCIN